MQPEGGLQYEFDAFRVDAGRRLLFRGQDHVPLPPKAFEVLLRLLESEGRIVPKEELLQEIWKDTFVEDNNLNQAVSAIRKALGDEPSRRRYIETVARVGYRFSSPFRKTRTSPSPPAGTRSSRVQSLAVLPFHFMDGDPTPSHLGLGIADTLITRLTRLKEIVVRPTSSIVGYAAAAPDPVKAAGELGVGAVVSGVVRRSGQQHRVTVQLIDGSDGSVLWAEKFDERSGDVFDIEDSIAERVARQLSQRASGERLESLLRRPTRNLEAHQLYLEAQYYCLRLTRQGFQRAIHLLNRAIDLDPEFALAYEGLAFYYIQSEDLLLSPSACMPAARVAALKALQLDEDLAEGHASLASVFFLYDWDWEGAESHWRRALELNPQLELAHRMHAMMLSLTGRGEEADQQIARLLEINPLELQNRLYQAVTLYFRGRYEEAESCSRRVVDLDPRFWLAKANLGRCLMALGKNQEAVEVLREARSIEPSNPEVLADLGRAYGTAGLKREANSILDELRSLGRFNHVPPYAFAQVYAGLGMREECLGQLEHAIAQRSWYATWLKADPAWDFVRDQARFQALTRRARL